MTFELEADKESKEEQIGEVGPRRVIAFFLDNNIGYIIAICFTKLLLTESPLLNGILLVVGYLVYFIVSETIFSKTIGKYVAGLEVKGIDGAKCNLASSVVRNLARLIEANAFFLGVYPAAIVMFFSGRRQRLGDLWANTLVVRSGS